MKTSEKTLFFLKYLYKMDVDLQNLTAIDDLEINFKIINPNKVIIKSKITLI